VWHERTARVAIDRIDIADPARQPRRVDLAAEQTQAVALPRNLHVEPREPVSRRFGVEELCQTHISVGQVVVLPLWGHRKP